MARQALLWQTGKKMSLLALQGSVRSSTSGKEIISENFVLILSTPMLMVISTTWNKYWQTESKVNKERTSMEKKEKEKAVAESDDYKEKTSKEKKKASMERREEKKKWLRKTTTLQRALFRALQSTWR